ncbi:MAG: 6,7-dimethyl-8-ribityllumazine synthase [Gammaproteobacteria bacterium RIFCSPHIGHO2_12_FULL_40_19]|nr:MAG: 6,7-dimethyl-8-ribityllumazine synthase [Gammaproteobacteria bacterium RIFCSPHIGHO2_12_FULL_40_19]
MKKNITIKIAVIISRFNDDVTDKLKTGALERLAELGLSQEQLTVFDVPGAVEIPLIAKQCAKQKKYDAIICLGAVIRGETTHYDYVCEQVSQGCQQVMMQYDIPVIFGVLTTENTEQALDRVGGAHGHKGADAADAALEMIELMQQFN